MVPEIKNDYEPIDGDRHVRLLQCLDQWNLAWSRETFKNIMEERIVR